MNAEDNIRLKEFRQLKKEIRGSKEHLIVGIDIAKENHKAFLALLTYYSRKSIIPFDH